MYVAIYRHNHNILKIVRDSNVQGERKSAETYVVVEDSDSYSGTLSTVGVELGNPARIQRQGGTDSRSKKAASAETARWCERTGLRMSPQASAYYCLGLDLFLLK